jgi:aldehyde dehydrogenase (NAD+)
MRDPIRLNPVPAIAEKARTCFRSDVTRPYEFRRDRLRALEASMRQHEGEVFEALKTDLGKSVYEAYPAEVGLVYVDLKHALKHLKDWMKPTGRRLPMTFWPGTGMQVPEPLGTALIISPWNYPFQLGTSPLVGAIAAGCNLVLKPSELAPATSAILEKVLRHAFGDDGYVTVVHGGPETSQQLLAEKWDVIFFTGSTRVGQIVMEAASKHLTPVILELGGKSPCLIDRDADLETTARRIMWGKTYNAGQTCIGPDYALVHKDVKQRFVDACQQAVKGFYGDDPKQSRDYSRVISQKHLQRLTTLVKGGRVAFGGRSDEAQKYFEPTVVVDVDLKSPLMNEEIFGPILPVLEVGSMDEAIDFVRARPKPLALYAFTSSSETADRILAKTSSGGAMVNDVLLHIASGMPFGGVGPSGMGSYHGKASFDAFTHHKTVVKKPWALDLKVRYPPYTVSLELFRKLLG